MIVSIFFCIFAPIKIKIKTNLAMKTKRYTNEEQSRTLIEFGFNNADMLITEKTIECYVDDGDCVKRSHGLAWSEAALMDMLPSEITIKDVIDTFIYLIRIRKYKLMGNVDVYQIAYGNDANGTKPWKDMVNTGEYKNLVDAAYDMVCTLSRMGWKNKLNMNAG